MKKLISFMLILALFGCTTTTQNIIEQQDLLNEIEFFNQNEINQDIDSFELAATDCYIYTLTGKTRSEVLKLSGVAAGTAVNIAVVRGAQRAIIGPGGTTIGKTSSAAGVAAAGLAIAVPYFVDLAKGDIPDAKQQLATGMSICLAKAGYSNRLKNMWRPAD